jgi:ribonucleoside-diphosphate reductase beta chain
MGFFGKAELLALQPHEPLLVDSSRSFAFAVTDVELWDLYEKQFSTFWQPKEIDPSRDVGHWEKLTDGERSFISTVLAFFATSDGIVFDNVDANFSQEVKLMEAKFFYGMQGFMENIHSQVYMSLLKSYVKDEDEQATLINAIHDVDSIREKASWALKHFSKEIPFAHRLIAFAVVEGVFFSGAFCAIFWLKKYRKGLLEALTLSNAFIARDESLHCEFAVALFHRLQNKPLEADVHEMFKTAIELETRFTREALKINLIGMDAQKMTQYIQYVSDRLLGQLGYRKLFNAQNPFPFMESQSLRVTTNFFEGKVHEYALAARGSFSEEAEF